MWKTPPPVAKRRSSGPQNVPDAMREAVERTVQATVGSAQITRDRAQEAVDEIVRGAEAGAEVVRERVRGAGAARRRVAGALDERRPATHEDLQRLQADLRAITRRLDAIEDRLPSKASGAKAKRASSAKASRGTKAKPRAKAKGGASRKSASGAPRSAPKRSG
jgi:polyhydroxyalkanoate synthesis regulator phasin